MKVRCNLCGKIFASESEYLDGGHDKRIHDAADPEGVAAPLITKPKVVMLNFKDIKVEAVDAIR